MHCHYLLSHTFPIFFLRPDLDACDSPEKYPQLFHVILDVEVEGVDKQKDLTPPWEQFPCKDLSPSVLFSCHQEHQDALAIAGTVGTCARSSPLKWGASYTPLRVIITCVVFLCQPVMAMHSTSLSHCSNSLFSADNMVLICVTPS